MLNLDFLYTHPYITLFFHSVTLGVFLEILINQPRAEANKMLESMKKTCEEIYKAYN